MTTAPSARGAGTWPGQPAARLLVWGGVVAGPLYLVTWLAQAAARDGFDLSRHPASALVNGPGGWVQVANLVGTGVLTALAGIGLRRADAHQRWVGHLVTLYGLGLLGGGLFRADPVPGFPPGTPDDVAVSGQGTLHFVFGAIGFAGFFGACIAAGRLAHRCNLPRWSQASYLTGAVFLAAFIGIGAGGGSRPTILAFTAAVIIGWAWLTAWTAATATGLGTALSSRGGWR